MNSASFDTALATALGDSTGFYYTSSDRQQATLRAVREYGRYRPCMRRMGQGNLVAAYGVSTIPAGSSSLLAVGGIFLPGDTLSIDPYGYQPESATISTVAEYASSVGEPSGMVTITLTAPTQFVHLDGTFCQRQTLGLTINVNQDTYPLPPDFVTVRQESFDLCTGIKAQPVQTNSFYDASYMIMQQLSGVGWGQATLFGPAPYGGYPIVGNPFDNPLGVPGGNSNSWQWQTVFRFYRQGPIPLMNITPPPQAQQILDPFFYLGAQIIGNIKEDDIEPVLNYSCACAQRAKADQMNRGGPIGNGGGDLRVGEVTYRPSLNVKELVTLADKNEALFDIKIRKKAIFVSG